MKTKLMWILVGIAALGLHAGMAAAAETQVPEECLAAEPEQGGPAVLRSAAICRRAALPRGAVCAHRRGPLGPSDRHRDRQGDCHLVPARHQVRHRG